ncbi:hypothetical protein N7520_002631 [Penicillium odoratum]|uniref:uncharacterized protein n=1 Tax=Penicillium odoratum TaxID=1167516 RepID=UPI00254787AE|nr:uncharacterized protein N7520_002631 [Penicillium odoratum]KAJ5772102.1 hypothetical protein N7520_002631 [Penicillium odoratum]
MAEIVGTVSAAAGLATFVAQVAQRIDDLNATYKYNHNEAGNLVKSLISHLKILRRILQFVQTRATHPAVEEAVVECNTIYSTIDFALEELLEKVSFVAPGQRNGLKVVKQLFSRDIRKEIERIDARIEKMNINHPLQILLSRKILIQYFKLKRLLSPEEHTKLNEHRAVDNTATALVI